MARNSTPARGGTAQMLITVGKPKSDYVGQGLADYAARLKPYGGCKLRHLKAERALKGKSPAQLMAAEAERVLAALEPRLTAWALHIKGEPWTSERWARELAAVRESAAPRLALIIGGAEGLDGAVLQRAQARVSLGPITLPHELAALTALEQLYRAHTILAGLPYHRA